MKRSNVTLSILLGLMFLLTGCSMTPENEESITADGGSVTTSPSTTRSYGGSDPKGDLVVVMVDEENSQVRRINYTTVPHEDSGWLSYEDMPADEAGGFSILKKVIVDSNTFVAFAEFEETALIYQVFDSSGEHPIAVGNPNYVVYREQFDKSHYYERAYNWMKFKVDMESAEESDMETGFAAFDGSSEKGLLYGAGYSHRRQLMDSFSTYNGISGINSSSAAKVDNFVYNPEAITNTMWMGQVGDYSNAVSLTGTASGANVIDFGPGTGGGMALAIPQHTTPLSLIAGTFFTVVYEYDKLNGTSRIQPMKVVITSTNIKVYNFSDNTAADAPLFNEQLTAIKDYASGPYDPDGDSIPEPVVNTFLTAAGNSSGASPIVQNAHLCNGAFLAVPENGGTVLSIIMDESGNFGGFTMFEEQQDSNYIVRFGFSIKDPGYVNQ